MKTGKKETKVFYTKKAESDKDFARVVKMSNYYTFELSKEFVDKEIVSVMDKMIIEDKYRSPETEIRRVHEIFDREYNRELDKLVYVKYENRNIAIGIISTRNNLWRTSYRYKVKGNRDKDYDTMITKVYDYLFVVNDDIPDKVYQYNYRYADVNDFLKIVKEYCQKVYDIENEHIAMRFAYAKSPEKWMIDDKERDDFWNKVAGTRRRINEFLVIFKSQFEGHRAYSNLEECAKRLDNIYTFK